MTQTVTIESGFAEVGAGAWLMGRAQPAAFFGKAVRRRRKGWVVRDRSRLDLVETTGAAKLANASHPFLTHIPCAATVSAVSDKVLVAPASARLGDQTVKAVPMSAMRALVVTLFGLPPKEVESRKSKVEGPDDATMQRRNDATGESSNGSTVQRSNGQTDAGPDVSGPAWIVMATASRTSRIAVSDGDTLSVRPDAVVAWTGQRPTGFCPKLGIWDVLLPRGPKDLLFNFHGPCIVWIEGAFAGSAKRFNGSTVQRFNGGYYGL